MKNRYYKAIYCGNGKAFNLVCVFYPEVNEETINAVVKILHENAWAVAIIDSDVLNASGTLTA